MKITDAVAPILSFISTSLNASVIYSLIKNYVVSPLLLFGSLVITTLTIITLFQKYKLNKAKLDDLEEE